MGVLKLTQIWIYPVKSLGGIRVDSANVMGKGLQYDRRWMLVDHDGVFMTQRVHTSMALFTMGFTDGEFQVSHKHDVLSIPFEHEVIPTPLTVKIWDDEVTAFEVDTVFSRWFSDRLGVSCRLVAFPEENPRRVDPDHVASIQHVSLADAYPYLIIGENSLADLNERLGEPVTIERFRPNFVYSGGEAYEEDTWTEFAIGEAHFLGVKPCARCVLTTVNPETGVKGIEPLKTLSTYRKRNNKILFGQNVIALDHKSVHVGDQIKVSGYVSRSQQGSSLTEVSS